MPEMDVEGSAAADAPERVETTATITDQPAPSQRVNTAVSQSGADVSAAQPVDRTVVRPTTTATIDCPACGVALPVGAAYCTYCGAAQPRTPTTPESASAALPTSPQAAANSTAHALKTTTDCPACGVAVPTGSAYCTYCGAAQTTSTTARAGAQPVVLPAPQAGSAPLGPLVGNYPGSPARFIWIVLVGALAAFGVLASLVQGSFGGLVFWLVVGGACYAYYYYYGRQPFYADIFEQGLVIARNGKTTTARWDNVANVEHAVTTMRYDFIIPVARTHAYHITLTTGERVKITSSFSKYRELGDTLQRMWSDATLDRRARAIAQRYGADEGSRPGQ